MIIPANMGMIKASDTVSGGGEGFWVEEASSPTIRWAVDEEGPYASEPVKVAIIW